MGDFKSINDPAVSVESRTRKKHRVFWSPELHQKFLNAIEQLGGDYKALPKHIHALMNVEGLTRQNVATHLQKYRLNLKRLDGLRNINATRQLPSSAILSGSPLDQIPLIDLEKMNISSLIQQGPHQNSSNSANHNTQSPRVKNVISSSM